MFAHDDERAVVYQLDLERGRIAKRFQLGRRALRGDFEGIAYARGRIFLVTSGGRVFEVAEGGDGTQQPFASWDTGVGPGCEVEGLTWDPDADALLLACKQPRNGDVALYIWSLGHHALTASSPILIPGTAFARFGLASFHPSAIDRHPDSGHYFLLAAREHAIAEVTREGTLVAVARVPAAHHRQFEGLALPPDGRLIVADEGRRGRARVTIYRPPSP